MSRPAHPDLDVVLPVRNEQSTLRVAQRLMYELPEVGAMRLRAIRRDAGPALPAPRRPMLAP